MNDTKLLEAIKAQVMAAAKDSLSSATGLGVSNITVVPVVTSTTALTVIVYSQFSSMVNVSSTMSAAEYAASPAAAIAAAVEAAKGGPSTATAIASLSAATARAAATTASLVNGTTLTGEPPATLADRVAAAVRLVLLASDSAALAALVNASSVALSGEGVAGTVTVSISSGSAGASGGASGVAAGGSGLSVTQMGGLSGASFAALASVVVYALYRHHNRGPALPARKLTISKSTSGSDYSIKNIRSTLSSTNNPLRVKREPR